MVGAQVVRRLALALPEAVEADHHGFPSFRVAGRIFATLPDAGHVNVMLGADEVSAAVDAGRGACEPVHWGRRLAGVRVTLAAADRGLIDDLLRTAWTLKAPRRLAHPRRP
jgi:hypothetical protein